MTPTIVLGKISTEDQSQKDNQQLRNELTLHIKRDGDKVMFLIKVKGLGVRGIILKHD